MIYCFALQIDSDIMNRATMARSRWGYVLMTLAYLLSTTLCFPLDRRTREMEAGNGHWVGIWSAMPQLVEPYNLPVAPFVCEFR